MPSPSTTAGGSYIFGASWSNPEAALEPAGPEGVATDSEDEAVISAEDAQGFVNGVDDEDRGTLKSEVGKMTIGKMTVEGGEEITEVGKMTVQGGTEGDASSSTAAADVDVLQVGKMTIENVEVRNDLVDTGIGAEEGFQAAEAMTPDVAALASSDDDDLGNPIQQAFSGFLKVRE